MTISEITTKRELTKEEMDGPKGPTGYPMEFKINPEIKQSLKKPKAPKLTR